VIKKVIYDDLILWFFVLVMSKKMFFLHLDLQNYTSIHRHVSACIMFNIFWS